MEALVAYLISVGLMACGLGIVACHQDRVRIDLGNSGVNSSSRWHPQPL